VDSERFMRFMAAWALVHETADDGWKAAVARGSGQEPTEMKEGPEAFVDGLSAMIAEEKERLKTELAEGRDGSGGTTGALAEKLDGLTFEMGELRGRIETLQASIDALAAAADVDRR